jgi:hypothetical protein
VVYEQSHQTGDDFYAQRDTELPIDYLFGGLANTAQQGGMYTGGLYDIGPQYHRQVQLRLQKQVPGRVYLRRDGSNKYQPGPDQWGFFPGLSLGWVVTKEPFFRSLVSENILTRLKIKGIVGANRR